MRRVGNPKLALWTHALTGPLGALSLSLVITLLCGIFVEGRALALALALVVLIALGLGYPWLAVRCVSGRVALEVVRLREGERLPLRLELVNTAPLPLWGLKLEGIVASDEPLAPPFSLRPRERVSLRQERLALPRGTYPSAVPRLTCAFPFGLTRVARPLPCAHEALVWPSHFPAPPLPEGSDAEVQDGTLPSRKAGTSGDLIGVRDFRRGDSLRRIHWPQTARHDRLIVTERQALRLPLVQITLLLRGASAGPDSEREWAIRAAMSLIETWGAQGIRVELVIDDGTVQRFSGGVGRFRDALARVPWEGSRVGGGATSLQSPASVRVLVTTTALAPPPGMDLTLVAQAGGLVGHVGS